MSQLAFDLPPAPARERTYGCCGRSCGPLNAPRDAVYPHAPDCPNPNVGPWIHRETGWTIRRLRCVGKDGTCPTGGRFVPKPGRADERQARTAAEGHHAVIVLVCGSRTWTDEHTIHEHLEALTLDSGSVTDPDITLLHGDARGADTIAHNVAVGLGWNVEPYPADWERHGRRAGHLRNLAMLDYPPDLVLAFWDGQSPGTRHTITEARRRGIPVEVHTA